MNKRPIHQGPLAPLFILLGVYVLLCMFYISYHIIIYALVLLSV